MSFIYEITCSVCDKNLIIKSSGIDNDHDITIEVIPCGECIANALKDKEEEYQARMDESRI